MNSNIATEIGGERVSHLPFWLLFISFAVAEFMTTLLQPIAGLICYGITLASLLICSAFLNNVQLRNLLISLSLVPLVRIMSLSMPLASIPQIYWYLLIYIPLLVAAVVIMHIIGLKREDIGLIYKGLHWQIPCGIVLGLAVGVVEWSILRPEPLITNFNFQVLWLPATIMFVTTGFVEEFIFRGILQKTAEALMARAGLFYISAIFAMLHIGHLSALDVLVVFVIAVIFAAIVNRTGSLLGVIFAHGTTNVFLYFVGSFVLS